MTFRQPYSTHIVGKYEFDIYLLQSILPLQQDTNQQQFTKN